MMETDASNVKGPAPHSRARRILAVAVGVYVAGVLLVWALLRFYADVWWPATLILFGPRWIWGLPLVVLAPIAALRDRRLLAPLAVAALVVAIPIMGFTVALPRHAAAAPSSPDAAPPRRLRLMTYNVGEGTSNGTDLFRMVAEVSPDVVAIQECSAVTRVAHRQPGERYSIIAHGNLCLLSRSPIEKKEVQDPEAVSALGGTGSFVRYTVHLPAGDVSLVNIHLATVREGLEAFLASGPVGVPALKENLATRWAMSALARSFVDRAEPPLLVAGDFNLPIDSAIYRRDWSSFTNAFSAAGSGLGTTKRTRWFGVRIDHILLGPGWSCERAFIGPHLNGDHRPVVADLTWSG
jgi:endonuclease/exonuclease/phosphatase (EEP) superfamily protein YafD